MSSIRRRQPTKALGAPLSASIALHLLLLLGVFLATRTSQVALPPIYKVDLLAAPAGPRSIGEVPVSPTPPAPNVENAPVPKRAKDLNEAPSVEKPKRPLATKATEVPNAKSVPKNTPLAQAGGGPTGDKGTDPATVKTEGLDFPYPAYLNNIVNQVIARFRPDDRRPLTAEVSFLIHRDGSVSEVRITKSSPSYAYNLEAKGAVEAVGRVKGFGPLPDGFKDDALPVIFTFSPSVIIR